MKIITSNQCNGGCGKTTLVRNLAQALREQGKRVLEIDLDFQKSLTNAHNVKNQNGIKYTSFDIFTHQEIDIKKMIVNDFIQGNASNNEPLTFMMMNQPNNEIILQNALKPLKRLYDYVLIDTHNAMNTATKNAIASSDLLLMPCNDDVDCINGSIQVIYGANQIKQKYNPNLKMAFVFTMQHRTGKNICVADKNAYNGAKHIADANNIDMLPIIRYDSKINKAKQCLMDVFTYCHKYEKQLCNGANDYVALAQFIMMNY